MEQKSTRKTPHSWFGGAHPLPPPPGVSRIAVQRCTLPPLGGVVAGSQWNATGPRSTTSAMALSMARPPVGAGRDGLRERNRNGDPFWGGGGTGEEGSDGKEGGLVSLSLALTLTPIRFQFAKVDPASSQRRISQENAPRPWLIDDFGPASWGSTSGEGRQPVQRARGDRHGWKPLPPGLGPRGGGGAET